MSFFCVQAGAQDYVPGEVIVKLKTAHGSSGSYAFMGKASSEKEMLLKQSFGKMNMYHYALKKGQSVEAAVDDLKKDPDVEYAEPNYYLAKPKEAAMEQAYTAEEVQ